MGLPSINIVFQTVADNSIKMSQKGVVGMILQDPIVEGAFTITKVSDMDTRFSEENKLYIERAFTGYINQPRSLVIYAIKVTGEPEEQFPSLKAGLDYMATQQIDYWLDHIPQMKHKQQKSKHGFWKEEKKIPHRKQFCQNWQLTVKRLLIFLPMLLLLVKKHIRQMHFAVVLPV